MSRYGSTRRKESHEKSMSSYVDHARRDVDDLVHLLDDTFEDAIRARKIFEEIDQEELLSFRKDSLEDITLFIRMTPAQRVACLKRMKKSNIVEKKQLMLVVMAIKGCMVSQEVLELREYFRNYFAPGSGNRETVAELFNFAERLKQALSDEVSWPDLAFMDSDIDDGFLGDDLDPEDMTDDDLVDEDSQV